MSKKKKVEETEVFPNEETEVFPTDETEVFPNDEDEEVASELPVEFIYTEEKVGSAFNEPMEEVPNNETIENEPLVFETYTPVPVTVTNSDDNLSVIFNGRPVAKSYVLKQMECNHTIKILEVRPNAYISYTIRG